MLFRSRALYGDKDQSYVLFGISPQVLRRTLFPLGELTKDEVRDIALKYIDKVIATLKRSNKTLTIEPEALEKLVTEGYSMAYGARFLKRVIDDRIKLPLSQQWKEANAFRATVKDDQIVIESVGPRLIAASDPDAIAV